MRFEVVVIDYKAIGKLDKSINIPERPHYLCSVFEYPMPPFNQVGIL
jgi:hypothetical protein